MVAVTQLLLGGGGGGSILIWSICKAAPENPVNGKGKDDDDDNVRKPNMNSFKWME